MKNKIKNKLIEYWQTTPRDYHCQIYGIITPRAGGEFTLTCYAVKETKRYGIQMTEVNRAWSDRNYYQCKNIWKNWFGSTMIEFDEQRNRAQESYDWYNGKWGAKMKWSKGGEWFMPYVKYMNLDALSETRYKYCAYDRYHGNLSLIHYCRLFAKHKEVELLCKGCYWDFINEKFLDRMKDDKGLRDFFCSNTATITHDFLKGTRYTIQDVVRAYKNKWTLEEAHTANWARYALNKAPKGIDRIELAHYLKKNNIDAYDYYHYAETVAEAKEDILAFGNTFPKDFHKREKQMQKKIAIAKAKEDREREEALKMIAVRINALLERMSKKLAWRVGDYSVIVPTTRKEFVTEGNAMHNCIGGYFEKCADGETICFFIRKNGKRLADVEISPTTGAIRQCRAKYNKDTDKDTRDFAMVFGKKLANMMKRKAA